MKNIKYSDIESVTRHGVHPSYAITKIDSEIGHQILRCFTSDMTQVERVLPFWPFQKKRRHGNGRYILMYHLRNNHSVSIAVADPGYIILDGCYYEVPVAAWNEGQQLVDQHHTPLNEKK